MNTRTAVVLAAAAAALSYSSGRFLGARPRTLEREQLADEWVLPGSTLDDVRVDDLPLLTAEQEYVLPDTLAVPYSMASPRGLLITDFGTCELHIYDGNDRALHTFTCEGSYAGTLTTPGREGGALHSPLAMASTLGGRALAVLTSDWRLATIGSNGEALDEQEVEAPRAAVVGFFGDSVLALQTAQERSAGPLLQLYNMISGRVANLGQSVPAPDSSWWIPLNSGMARRSGSVVWFARPSDARVFRFDISQTPAAADTIAVPVLFAGSRPYKFKRDLPAGAFELAQVENHITAAAALDGDRMVIAQRTATRLVPQSSSVLRLVGRSGLLGTWRVQGSITRLAARPTVTVAVVRLDDGSMHVRRFAGIDQMLALMHERPYP